MPIFLKRLWDGWMRFSHVFGSFMSRLIFSVLYFTVFLPYGIGVRLFSDPLDMKSQPKETGWRKYPSIEATLRKHKDLY